MKPEVIYEVVSTYHHPGSHVDGSSMSAGCFRSHEDALACLDQKLAWMDDQRAATPAPDWSYSWRIDMIDQRGLFRVPSQPTPRQRFTARESRTSAPGSWTKLDVEVLDEDGNVRGRYHRNYSMLKTFEPFRQGDRDFALISPDYTATSVLDLQTGLVIASETPHTHGFCPVGFYVPDWWDVNTITEGGRRYPGSLHWSTDYEWPTGDFGFVFGCVWGDDSTYKVQHLDLSDVQNGIIRRDDRFGYVEVADHEKLDFKDLVSLQHDGGDVEVRLSILQDFSLADGRRCD